MYAQVVFNLPIEGPFDYSIPAGLEDYVYPGIRVRVFFGNRNCIGYVTGKIKNTKIDRIKPILEIIDSVPILNRTMLTITRQAALYYSCSWGEMIETAIPVNLRQGRKIEIDKETAAFEESLSDKRIEGEVLAFYDVQRQTDWSWYSEEIKKCIDTNKTVIMLSPYRESSELVQKQLQKELKVEVGILHSYLSKNEELKEWVRIKNKKINVVAGTRMAVFAPLDNLGLILIQDEQCPVYKQELTPHYNAVGVARIRSVLESAKLVFLGRSMSLENWYEIKKDRVKCVGWHRTLPARQVKIVDLNRAGFIPQRRKIKFSIPLEDAVTNTIRQKGRVLLFINRRGFAVFASCSKCAKVLRCPRCNANLVLHFKSNKLHCHQCNYKIDSPGVCPSCNQGYIQYSGLGIEKLESELRRIYPQTNIFCLDRDTEDIPQNAQIIVATESIFKYSGINFDLIGVVSSDMVLNFPDFRASEKIFALLIHLASLTGNSLIIQTIFPEHYCFQALAENNMDVFYETELSFRRNSGLPPFTHIILVKLRGIQEEKVNTAAEELFNILTENNRNKSVKIVSYSHDMHYKIRDKFYVQILIKSKSVLKAVDFLKKHLVKFRRSGIIITVDVDPV